MLKLSNIALIFLVAGISLAIIGFILSDKDKYPVASKFSGIMIVAGIITASLSVATKWNPIK